MTWGNQKCIGGIPPLIISAIAIIISLLIEKLVLKFNKFNEHEKIKIVEAIVWVKKYLIAASEELELNFLIIRGIIIIKFNSNPNHAVNHDDALHAIIVLTIKRKMKFIWYFLIKIIKRKFFFHRWGMNPIA